MERLARYGSITTLLRKFWDKVRDAYFFMFTDEETFREEVFLMLTKEALDAVADAFSVLVGKPCRTGIKWLDEIPESAMLDDWGVRDLVRSSNMPSPRDAVDRVGENTDFRSIIEDQAPYFFSNDLISDFASDRYDNSHWSDEEVAAGNVRYASAVVAPIGRFLADPALTRLLSGREPTADTAAIQPELVGFLWVDTRATDAFDEATDVQLLVSLASGLYPLLSLYRDLSSAE